MDMECKWTCVHMNVHTCFCDLITNINSTCIRNLYIFSSRQRLSSGVMPSLMWGTKEKLLVYLLVSFLFSCPTNMFPITQNSFSIKWELWRQGTFIFSYLQLLPEQIYLLLHLKHHCRCLTGLKEDFLLQTLQPGIISQVKHRSTSKHVKFVIIYTEVPVAVSLLISYLFSMDDRSNPRAPASSTPKVTTK